MARFKRCRDAALALAAGGVLSGAMATNGYFPHGYGLKAQGMGGAAATATDGGFAGANNPAAAAFSGDRIEGGLGVFMPRRGVERSGGVLDGATDSGSGTFYVPEFGYNRQWGGRWGFGLTVYGHGGMNTNYPGGQIDCGAGPANMLCGSGPLGVDLMQLVVAPTAAYKPSERHAFGVSPLLVLQQFKAYGLQAFDNAPGFPPMTGAPGSVTDRGHDQSRGLGLRLGYLGQLTDRFSVGVAYAPKIRMSRFDQYRGLFADGGRFDIPANLTLGVGWQATPALRLALDYSRIRYSGVASVGDPSGTPAPLGAPGGPGFGWRDVNVWKLGVQWQARPALQLRAGVNVGGNPVRASDVTFNIIAPGVMQVHYTLGATWAVSDRAELTLAYMVAPRRAVSGPSMFNAFGLPAGSETIHMRQQSLGLQFGWKF